MEAVQDPVCKQESVANDDFIIEVLRSEENAYACARLIAEAFAKSNPMTVFKGISAEVHFEKIALPLALSVLNQELSLLVRKHSTDEIIGCILSTDLYLKSICSMTNTTGIAHEDLIADLDRMSYEYFNATEQLTRNSVIHFLLHATKIGEEGNGVGSYLIRETCKYAREIKGFKYAHAQTTNPAMKHIYDKIGGEVISQIDPATWMWKNCGNSDEYPFKTWTAGPMPNICVKL
ncbi:unnamed protein product [Adineta ricciae]|uniref:N-acetyltransferase domain-containing protein n=1 Tax=Adineta ricciae TaxID=249248 RepID=A0A815JXZ3_ADIRI|nr:unnamed protein product [Adineta ricciae]CAF1419609.1 unnamed protein product [Adineta ricciae]